MKKNIFTTLFFVVFFAVTSCNEAKKEEQKMEEPVVTETQTTATEETTTEETTMAAYQCPMKCEQEKSYAEKGNCPVCKMELKELAAADMESGHDNSVH